MAHRKGLFRWGHLRSRQHRRLLAHAKAVAAQERTRPARWIEERLQPWISRPALVGQAPALLKRGAWHFVTD